MVIAYGLEARHPVWLAVFAGGCLSTAIYGVLSGAWIFAVLEAVWSVLAVRRFTLRRRGA